MTVKLLAQIHFLSMLIIGMFMGSDTPIITGYISWSIMLWLLGYPVYYLLGEPGWDDL